MSESLREVAPAYMQAWDGGDWSWYVHGHDPAELAVIDEPDDLTFAKVWMRPIPASAADDYGVFPDDAADTVIRDPTTGRFKQRVVWLECDETHVGAEPYMGCRLRPEVMPP